MREVFRCAGQTREKSALVTRRFEVSEEEITPAPQVAKDNKATGGPVTTLVAWTLIPRGPCLGHMGDESVGLWIFAGQRPTIRFATDKVPIAHVR